jgi:uncharacterized delta-60 repeat protein
MVKTSLAQEEYCGLNTHTTIDFNYNSNQQLYHVEKLSNGKIMMYGRSYYTNGNTFRSAIVRLNPDATIDTSFSSDGKVDYYLNQRTSIFYGFTDFNNKVYAIGKSATSNSSSAQRGTLFRLNENGEIDTTFSDDGFQVTPYNNVRNFFGGFIHSDSTITIVGATSTKKLIVLKYLYDGTIDSTFNTVGYKLYNGTNLAASGEKTEFVKAENNEFYVVLKRYDYPAATTRPTVYKFNSAGYLDTTFNSSGKLDINVNIGGSFRNVSGHYNVNQDRLYVGATSTDYKHSFIARLTPQGTLDSTFASNGYLWSPEVSTNVNAWGITTDPNSGNVIQYGKGNTSFPFIFQTDSNGTPILTCGDSIEVLNLGFNYDHYFTNSYFNADGKLILLGCSGQQDPNSSNSNQAQNFLIPTDLCFLNDGLPVVVNETICNGEVFNFNSNMLSQAGTYTDTLSNVLGCDSIVELYLTVNQTTNSEINKTICDGEEYIFNNQPLTQAGVYFDTLANANNCDSIVKLNLEVESLDLNISQKGDTLQVASGFTYSWINCETKAKIGHSSSTYIPEANGFYACVISSSNCSDTTDCIEIKGIGLDELKTQTTYFIKNGVLTFTTHKTFDIHSVQLFNVLGQRIYSTIQKLDDSTYSLETKDLLSGVYLISFGDSEGVKGFKFVK